MSNAESKSLSAVPESPPIADIAYDAVGAASVWDLLFRPRRFYASPPGWLRHPATLPAIALIAGIDVAVGRLERVMIRPDGPRFSFSWPIVWGLLILSGALSGALLWTMAVWWFRVRLRWSGAPRVDPEAAREVYFPAVLVRAAPTVLLLLFATTRYANYRAYWEAPPSAGDVLMLAFPFWSIWIGYRGVRARFPVSRWRARLWFFVAPAVVFIALFGAMGAVLSLAD